MPHRAKSRLGAPLGETTLDHEFEIIHDSAFVCRSCGHAAPRAGSGTRHRNHCPRCLFSLHLDAAPGDRLAACGGLMEPVAVWVRKGGEWAIIHRCRECGALASNRVAGDDNAARLLSIAVRPLSSPPFPLERLREMVSQESPEM